MATGADSATSNNGGALFPAKFAETVSTLPQETRFLFPSLRLYQGFWIPEVVLTALPEVHARFQPSGSDILLASFPKSGTTWLKSLGFATVRRSVYPPSDPSHPLLHSNAHDCVKFIDRNRAHDEPQQLSPRVLATLTCPTPFSPNAPMAAGSSTSAGSPRTQWSRRGISSPV